jgi:class 3 adenylate cyclase/predicted ATPase
VAIRAKRRRRDGSTDGEVPTPVGGPAAPPVSTCGRCFAPIHPEARFCAFCGTPVGGPFGAEDAAAAAARGTAAAIERRHVIVLFCDMVDSSRLATLLDPEDLTDVIRTFQRRVGEVMAEYGGVVAQRLGDGALVYFGYPRAAEDDPECAVRAALAVAEAIPQIAFAGGLRLRVRVGAATGIAVVGDVAGTGDGAGGGLEIAGEAPNLAARLKAIAEPDRVVVSDGLRALTGDLFRWRDLGRHALQGWSEPVQVWEALGATGLASRSEARQRAAAPLRMLGRDAAAERLMALWRKALGGEGCAVLIRGEAGIGKSRLIADLLQRTSGQRHTRLHYFCAPHQHEAPLYPFVQHIERFAGFANLDGAEDRLKKLRRALPAMPEDDLALVAGLLAAPQAGQPQLLAQHAPFRRRERTLEALHGSLRRLAALRPVLAVFEDAHWADPTSSDLVGLAVRRLADMRALLVITARPEFAPDWAAAPGIEGIELAPLNAAEAAELVRLTAGGEDALSPSVVEEIVRRSDGVPLYLEELTKAVLEDGAVAQNAAGGGLGPIVPPSIQASLLARLDRLQEARVAAQVAAAIGRDFDGELLGRVAGLDAGALRSALGRLLASGLVVAAEETAAAAAGGRYRFKHALIRDVAYGTAVRPRRRELHARIARALEAEVADGAARKPHLLAHHLTEAGLAAEAAARWLQAGLQSLQQSATMEALAQLGRGLALLPDLPEGEARMRLELDLQIARAKCLFATAGWAAEVTGETFARARVLCDALGARPQLRAVLFGQWTRAFLRADLAGALRLAEEMLGQGASPADGPVWLVVGHYAAGMTQHSLGAFGKVREHLGRGIALFDPALREAYAGPVVGDPRVIMRTYLAYAQLCAGDFDAAWQECGTALAEARELGQALALAHAVWRRAFHATFAESPAAGLAGLDEFWPIVEEHGLPYYHALGAILRGWCIAALGDPATGLAVLRGGLAIYGRTGSLLYLPSFYRMEAEVLGMAGATEEGLARVEEAERLMRHTGELWDDGEIARVHGVLLAARGDAAAAEATLRDALARAEARGAGWFALRAATSLARVLADVGRRGAAAAVLEPVSARFGAATHSADLREARALLATLSGGPAAAGA